MEVRYIVTISYLAEMINVNYYYVNKSNRPNDNISDRSMKLYQKISFRVDFLVEVQVSLSSSQNKFYIIDFDNFPLNILM